MCTFIKSELKIVSLRKVHVDNFWASVL